MLDYDGPDELGDACDDDDDDIARFERACAERARAEGLPVFGDNPHDEDDAFQSDDEGGQSLDMSSGPAGRGPARKGAAPAPAAGSAEWQEKCAVLQDKLKRREAELSQVRGDLSMVKSDGASTGDPTVELKSRLLHLTKFNRRMQVTDETQKSRIKQLEGDLRKLREPAQKKAEDLAMQQNFAILGDGVEDWKQKYLYASNQLQEARHSMQDVRSQNQRHKKLLLKELGSDEALEKALSTVDDPNSAQWKGRAAQISQLQRQVKELRAQKSSGAAADDALEGAEVDGTPSRGRRTVREPAAEKDRAPLLQAADKRREEFEKVHEEVEKLRGEQAEAKRKANAFKARVGLLEGQLRDCKGYIQTLVAKSENDDQLVTGLQTKLGREGGVQLDSGADSGAVEAVRQQNDELKLQLERQAQIMLQLRQKNLASAVDVGSTRIGASAPSTPQSDLVTRVRYLEAENSRQTEHIRLIRGSGVGGSGTGAGSTEQIQLLEQQLANAEEDNDRLRLTLQRQGGGESDDDGADSYGDGQCD